MIEGHTGLPSTCDLTIDGLIIKDKFHDKILKRESLI